MNIKLILNKDLNFSQYWENLENDETLKSIDEKIKEYIQSSCFSEMFKILKNLAGIKNFQDLRNAAMVIYSMCFCIDKVRDINYVPDFFNFLNQNVKNSTTRNKLIIYSVSLVQWEQGKIAMLKLIISSKQQDLLQSNLDKIFTIIKQLSVQSQFQILQLCFNQLKDHARSIQISQKILTIFDSRLTTDLQPHFKALLKSQHIDKLFILNKCKAALQRLNAKNSQLHNLIIECLTGKAQRNQKSLQSLSRCGLDPQEYFRKTTLIKINRICQNHRIIKLSQLQAELHLDRQQLQNLLFQSIDQGLMQALINQQSQTLQIIKICHKYYDQESLNRLLLKLGQFLGQQQQGKDDDIQ